MLVFMNPHSQSAVVFETFGSPQTLHVQSEMPMPESGPGEARIRVQAASVQWTDTMIRRGKYPEVRMPGPFIPGYDLVGTVDAVGAGVTEIALGERVADLTTIGANARFVIRPAAGLTRVPEAVDASEATALVLSWMTAYQALLRVAKVVSGQRVLVIGGNGAVGLAVIGLAESMGFETWVTSSEVHREGLEARGARVFPRDNWASKVSEAGGVDLVIDGVGAKGFAGAFQALRKGGRVVGIGMSSVVNRGGGLSGMGWSLLQFKVRNLWPNGKHGSFFSITSYRKKNPGHWSEDLARLFARLEDGSIRPAIAEKLTLEQVADAHRRLERGGLQGKLILDPWA